MLKNHNKVKYSEIMLLIVFFLYFFTSPLNDYLVVIGLQSRIFAIILIFSLFLIILQQRNKLKLNLICVPLLLWFILKISSILWGYNDIFGIEVVNTHFMTHILMAILLILFSFCDFEKNKINKIISLYYLATIIICLLQIVFCEPYKGISSRLTLTLFGVQRDPNDLATIYLVTIAISVYYTFFKNKYYNLIFLGLGIYACFLTGSRGGIISMAAILLCCIIYVIFFAKVKMIKKIYLIIIIFLSSVIAIYALEHFVDVEVLDRLLYNEYGDGSGRLFYWKQTLQLFIDRPIFGYGWGGKYVRTHNTYFSMLLDVGLIGTLTFIYFMIKLLVIQIKNKELLVVLILIAAYVPSFFIETITSRILWNAFFIAILFINEKKHIRGN